MKGLKSLQPRFVLERLNGRLRLELRMLKITQAAPHQIPIVRELFLEYGKSLGFSLCFQSFDKELAGLPGDYAPPRGRLYLAEWDGEVAGCVALHPLDDTTCEMKRLYVRPAFRGHAIGRRLVDQLVADARSLGYVRMCLDTVEPVMKTAVGLYRQMGFREIAPYCVNPMAGALYMELDLQAMATQSVAARSQE